VDTRVLKRTKNTRPQVGLNRDERLTNLRGAFEATSAVEGLSILLIDDVTTSGGTAVACAQALRSKGAVYVAALTFCGERLA
jgi:predicted amidophosphoribosyltransferase